MQVDPILGYLLTLLHTRRWSPKALAFAAAFYLAFAAALIPTLT